jgi:VanZ like family
MHAAGIVWVLMWALYAIPWTTLTETAHWDRVSPIPFFPRQRPRDDALNFVFFVPLGALSAAYGWGAFGSTAAAAIISVAGEALQIFATDRYPSITDVLTNISGALVGHWMFRKWLADLSPEEPP